MGQSLVQKTTFTVAAAGPTMGAPGGNLFARYAVQAKGVGGAATTFTATLQGSLDSVNWTDILTVGADGVVTWDATGQKPALFVRVNATVVTLGPASAVVVTVGAVL